MYSIKARPRGRQDFISNKARLFLRQPQVSTRCFDFPLRRHVSVGSVCTEHRTYSVKQHTERFTAEKKIKRSL